SEESSGSVWSYEALHSTIRQFSTAYSELRTSPLPQLPVELAIVELCTRDAGEQREQISEKQAENKIVPLRDTQYAIHNTPAQPAKKVESISSMNQEPITNNQAPAGTGLLTIEKLTDCWRDVI